MNNIVHFEIDAEDMERLTSFYKDIFGWRFTKWEGPMEYLLINTGTDQDPGVGGAVMKRSQREQFKNQTVNTIGVNSIDDIRERIEKAGGTLLTPKMTIPGVGYHSYCLDTEGNAFGILQEDPEAG